MPDKVAPTTGFPTTMQNEIATLQKEVAVLQQQVAQIQKTLLTIPAPSKIRVTT